jgi:hypothetical protein
MYRNYVITVVILVNRWSSDVRADVRDRRGSGERGPEPHGRCLGQRWAASQGMPAGNWWRSKRCLTVRSQHTRSRGSDGARGLV